ncbi:hypothetical protein F5141DRAFT_1063649 [Pisolithus sp. B1]|nr:hypothetical protein F5141DRAFT_1063649 [Pisolithus sp. B1]
MAEIDMPVQEEVTRLSSTLQAEKERELLNISKTALTLARTGQNWPAFDSKVPNWLASGSIFVRTEANVVVWCTKTFCKGEDAIKQIRKSQGISKQTWLIGVDIDDNGLDSGLALPGGHEGEGGGEVASSTQDDWLDSPPVSAMVEVVTKRVETALQTLLESGGHFSVGTIPWSPRQENHKLQLEKAMEPSYQCNFILAGVCCLFKEKLIIEQDNNFIMPGPSEKMMTILKNWKWLQHLINTLGDHGMSLEESSQVENSVKNKNIDQELEIIDLQQVLNKDIFCSQGRKPLPRKHAPDNPASSWAPVMALPMTLHDDRWILQLTEHQRESLKILKESFPWMKIVATLSWLYNFVGWERCSNDQGDSWAMIG